MPRLRIAILAPGPYPAPQGTAVLVRTQARALAAAGHAVHLFTFPSPGGPAEPFAWHRRAAPAPVTRSGPRAGRLAADVGLACMAWRGLRRLCCDVIVAHHLEGLAMALALRARWRVPVVYQAHTCLADELPTYARGGAWRGPLAVAVMAVERALTPCADVAIAFDPPHAAALCALGLPAARVRCIAPGLLDSAAATDVATTTPVTPVTPVTIVYSGNGDGYQNLALLYAALPLLRTRLPEARVHLVTHHAVADLGAPAGVACSQVASYAGMQAELRRAHIGICPRVLPIGVPIKLLNYRACGLPVVTCAPSARHWLDAPALHVAPPTPAGLVAAILACWRAHAGARVPCALPPLTATVPDYEAALWQAVRRRAPDASGREGGARGGDVDAYLAA